MKKLILRSLQWASIYLSCLLLSCVSLHGQDSYDVNAMFKAYEEGYHLSMRDVFSVLDNSSSDAQIRRVKSGLLFDLQDPAFRATNTSEWLPYYYKHREQIQYYPEWGMFLRNDLHIPNLSYAILDNQSEPSIYIRQARSIYNTINEKTLHKVVASIGALSLQEVMYSKRILIECLEILVEKHSCEKMITPFAAITSKLITLNDQFIHQQIDQILKEKSCSDKVQRQLLVNLAKHKEHSLLYNNLSEQLLTFRSSQFITHLKAQRYTEVLGINGNYFDHKVDHYGKLLAGLPLGNIVDEEEIITMLLESESPKALYYIVSKWFIYAKSQHPRAKALMDILHSVIDNIIQINTPDGLAYKCDNNTTDLLAKKSILAFWINNYKHYEWNDDINKYVNTNILKQDRQKLVHLYKNLNGDNSAFALKSYWKLIQSDPILLAEVDKIYSKKLLNYNGNLPSPKYKYLLQLSRLVQYCKTNNIEYQVDEKLQGLLTELSGAVEISEIILLENKIINVLNTDNITAFEIWAIVNSGKEHIKYSSTKISNIFYKKHIPEILASKNSFNLFLKKSSLFKSFGDHGSSKYYLKKIVDNSKISIDGLKHLKNESLDDDIVSSIEYVSNYKKRNDISAKPIDLNAFIQSPISFKESDLVNITKVNKHALHKLSSTFESKFTPSDQFLILEWIQIHTPKELLPFIVSLQSKNYPVLSAQNIEVPIQDFASQILSSYISNGALSSETWPKEYIRVFQEIFENDLTNISKSDELEIETINDILNSKFYAPTHRPLILNGLTKVRPARNIIACALHSKLTLAEMQYLLPNIKSKNALDYLLKITNVENNDEVMSFLIDYMTEKGAMQAGRFFNDLFKKQWFTEYIDSDITSPELKIKIQWVLTNYWENEDGLSSFEEEQTVLNIIKIELAGKSIKERLDLILASFVDNEVKQQTIRKIIHQIDYASIATLLDYYDSIVEIGGVDLFKFITEDFGIPFQEFSDREAVLELAADLKDLSEEDLYYKYLNKIGVHLRDSNNKFDLEKAYSIITEDLVRPFVGTGGSVRDIYVFGTIKILEKEFGKTLGFHPKLNESQSFYKYTSKKRAQAWAEELSGLINTNL